MDEYYHNVQAVFSVIKTEERKIFLGLAQDDLAFSCADSLDSYVCPFCGLTTHLVMVLHKHILVAHKQQGNIDVRYQPYRCQKCDFNTFFLLSLLRHYRRQCLIYNCKKCPFKTFSKMNLSNHKRKHHTPLTKKLFHCTHCNYMSKSSLVLELHILGKHTDPNNVHTWFKCELCPYKGKHGDYLRKHMIKMHQDSPEDKWFECNQCVFRASSRYSLKAHKLEEHRVQKTYKCSQCSFSAQWKIHLTRHETDKHASPEEIQWFPCEQCDYKSKRKDNLKQHVKAKHAEVEEWFQCDVCRFRTRWKKNLKLHKTKLKHNSETAVL